MITRIHGKLIRLEDEYCVLSVDPFEYEVLIPDLTRRQLQTKIGENIGLHTMHYFEGNPARGGKMIPRLIGFANEIEREFFDLICSVSGVGVKKGLRAMVRPVDDIARAIEQQDVNGLKTLPGISATMAEKMIAELRRKMAKFALMIPSDSGEIREIERDLVDEVYQILVTLGWSETDTRKMLESALQEKKKYKDVDDLLQVVWEQSGAR